MTLVTDIKAVSAAAVSGSVSPPSKCVLQPAFWRLSWGTSARRKRAALCPSDYSKQICGHKYDTLSSWWFMKSTLTAEFLSAACLRRRRLEEAAAQPANYRWQDSRNLSLRFRWQMKKGESGESVGCWLKYKHTPRARLEQQKKRLPDPQPALLTRKLCKENLFAAANEETDLRSS